MFLRQSTAVTVEFGPFVGVDGLAESTALSSQTGRVTKNGTSSSLTPSSWTHQANGNYAVGLSTSHTDTIGRMRVSFQAAATYLPVWRDFVVLHAAVYDWLFGSTAPSTYAGGAVASVTAPVVLAAAQPNYAPAVAGDVNAAATAILFDTAALLTRLTSTRAGYLDNLSGGAVALASQIPAAFTSALFASAGVFSVGALANAPTGGGGDVTLAASQPNYAPAKASDLAGLATSAEVASVGADVDALATTVGAAGAGLTAIPRTGYKLAADGLDAIPTTEPTTATDGPVTGWTFPQLLRWGVMRFMRVGKTPSTLTVQTLAGGTSTAQALADDSLGTESTGAPT